MLDLLKAKDSAGWTYYVMVSFWIANEVFLPKNMTASKDIKCKVLNMKPW